MHLKRTFKSDLQSIKCFFRHSANNHSTSTALVLRSNAGRVCYTNDAVLVAGGTAVMPALVPIIGGGGGVFGRCDVSPDNCHAFSRRRTAAGTTLRNQLYSSLCTARRQRTIVGWFSVVGRFAADIQQVRHPLADFGHRIVTGALCIILTIAAIHQLGRRVITPAAHRSGSSADMIGERVTGSLSHKEQRNTIHGAAATSSAATSRATASTSSTFPVSFQKRSCLPPPRTSRNDGEDASSFIDRHPRCHYW